jgi:nitrate reductase gamma subunit
MMGAAVATVAAYSLMFVLMAVYAQRIYTTPYQWRRVAIALAAAIALLVVGKLLDASLPLAIALCAAYPLALLPLGFYLPAERARLRRLLPSS